MPVCGGCLERMRARFTLPNATAVMSVCVCMCESVLHRPSPRQIILWLLHFWLTENCILILISPCVCVSAWCVCESECALRVACTSVTLAICLLLTQFIIIYYLLSSNSFSSTYRCLFPPHLPFIASAPLRSFVWMRVRTRVCVCVYASVIGNTERCSGHNTRLTKKMSDGQNVRQSMALK